MDRDSYVYKTTGFKAGTGGCDAAEYKADGYADDSDHPGAEGCVGIFQGGGVSHRQGDGYSDEQGVQFHHLLCDAVGKTEGALHCPDVQERAVPRTWAQAVVQALEDQLGISIGETTEDGRFTLEYCPCLGLCEISPAIMINEHVYGNLTPESVRDIIKQYIRRMWNSMEEMHVLLKTAARLIREVHRSMRTAADLKR